ncbi:DNA-directed RNA polymerase [Parastagonospora nodorum]|nr:DNA-directed RNA polymerase [Parastagonospora nodorum]
MLARAARRNLRSDAVVSHAKACEQLTLPWLCPAAFRRTTHTSALFTTTPTPAHTSDGRRAQRRSTSPPRRQSRSLATTAELQPTPAQSPFHGLMQAWGSRTPSPELARLTSWDRSNPLVLRDELSVPQLLSKRLPVYMGTSPLEMYQNLYACLRVDRVDRAAIILARLTDMLEPSAPELVDAHNMYFQTLLNLALQDPKPESMSRLEDWYALNFEAKGIKPTSSAFVTLLRGAMNFLEGAAQDEAIAKYVSMARQHGEDMVDEINYSSEFPDEEWNLLIRAQPDEFEEPPRVEEVRDMLVNTPESRKGFMELGLPSDFSQRISEHISNISINPVPQKGFGLDSLKHALSMFADETAVPYPHDMAGTQEDKDRHHAHMRQLRMEQDGLDAAVQRWKLEDEKLQQMGVYGVMNTKSIQALMYNWYSAVLPLFKKHIERAKEVMAAPTVEVGKDPLQIYGPWLERCKPEKLAALTVSRAVSSSFSRDDSRDTKSLKISALTVQLGTDIMDYLNADAQERRETFLKQQRQQLRKSLVGQLHKTDQKSDNSEQNAAQTATWTSGTVKTRFPVEVKTLLGALCLELLMQTATITFTANDLKSGKQLTSTQAAFHHGLEYVQGKKIGYLSPHPELVGKLRKDSVANIQPVNLPMIVEPKPWTSFQDGGYYTQPQRVVRQKAGDPAQRAYAESAIENGDMAKVLAGLDVLGKVPWQINAPILEVMLQAWNKGEGIAGLIPENHGLEPPVEPPADAPRVERAKWAKKLQEHENLKSGLHSQRCFQNFQLEIARAFAAEKKIYFPHSVDFRGRAYPLSPVLNHIGADLARGLLKFANGKELGTVGLHWLKIHLANLYGYDKASLKEREQFAMDNLSDIYDSATNPLDGRRWWLNAEDPWQCLACCMELKNAFDSADPTRYKSQFPVHQDGTCNGLQHYAALGGDHAGARQVNLEPSDRPQDIYTGVAELVKGMVKKDAEKGVDVAKFVDGRITRKVVKRTVMTNVYGVTFMGAKKQVEDELKAIFPKFEETEKIRSLGIVAMYVAIKIFEALGQIFNGAQEIQYWLGECGDRITTSLSAEQVEKIGQRGEGKEPTFDPKFKTPKKLTKTHVTNMNKAIEAFKTSIIWTTPLKMPVVQPYRKDSTTRVRAKFQDITVVKRSSHDIVDKRKQLQAFPPNFIHSLDATHMTLSALKCHELGLDFAAVHDSFWTHASDIPNLNVILRDAFVRMHSDDIVGRLAEEFKARYAGAMHMANISASSEAAKRIRLWRANHYGSGRGSPSKMAGGLRTVKASTEEIELEYKRQKLLKSDNPEEVKQGQEMETPTSIWLQHQDPKALTSHRLGLIGETKKEKKNRYDEMRDKVLDREADVIAEEKGQEDADMPSEEASDHGFRDLPDINEKTVIAVWIPLTFPPPPKKGGWDISRLRESKYFFS